MNLTEWYPGNIKPVHVGVYERKNPRGSFSYWNGRFWAGWRWLPEHCPNIEIRSEIQRSHWRGVAK